ncbi:MAG: TlpA disulfide reductase family protein [Flavisolibacter sp.]
MKKLVCIFFLSTLFSCADKKNPFFVVEGNIKNSQSKLVFLEEDMAGNNQAVVVDSSKVASDGSFELSTPLKEETMFSLRTDGAPFPFALLINDSKKIHVKADLSKKPETFEATGSSATQKLIDYDAYLNSKAQTISITAKQVDSLMKAKAADTLTGNKYGEFATQAQQMKAYTSDFIDKSPSPVLSLYALGAFQKMSSTLGIKGFTETETAEVVNKQAVKFPNNTALNDIRIKLQPHKAPDFTLPDTSGHNISLSSFKGQFVLVDFWASWCEPCRGENPNVVKAYNQFKNRNFTILSVSLDKEKNAWLKAINDDGLTWNHVSDLKFWNSAAAGLFNVSSIPSNFLIDPKGNIIAENIRGPELISKLQEVLH